MEDEVDALFKLPLGEFTPARNALAARLKKAGRQAEADEVKALAKPSASAWVVNQLYWRHRGAFDRLVDAGERLRKAQAAQLTRGADVREPLNARREAVAALLRVAEEILRDGGHGATRDALRRVTSTLETLSIYASLPDAPRAGRLADDVETTGFETVAALLPGAATSRAAPRPPAAAQAPAPKRTGDSPQVAARRAAEQRKRLVAEAKAAVREAERALSAARKQAERAAAARETAATRLARAAKEAEAAREKAAQADADARRAVQAAEGAERALELARRRLEHVAED